LKIDRRQFADHKDRFEVIVSEVHRVTASIVMLSFVGYGVAVYVWYQGHPWLALFTATIAYGFFRAFRPLSVFAAKLRLRSRPGFDQTLVLFENELIDRKPHDVLSDVEKRLEESRQRKTTCQEEEK
jgi:hypothetical protein